MKEWKDFNLNEEIKVKLTREGIHHYYAEHEKYGIVSNGPPVDEEGWAKMQAWAFFELYGHDLRLGGPTLFNVNIQIHLNTKQEES